MRDIQKIVLIGPESTGKSTLSQQLAAHYNTQWVPEYAREYLEKNGTAYTYENLLTIAKGQLQQEDEYTNALVDLKPATSSKLLVDTDMYVMKVWSEYVFGKCDNWILNQVVHRKYDLYLLCNVDLPWVKDNLREYPDLPTRNRLYKFYKDHLVNQAVPWVEISGNYEERLASAVRSIDSILT